MDPYAHPRPNPPVPTRPAQTWWLLIARGGAAIAFGVLALLWPGLTLLALAIFWGAYALLDGLLSLVHAWRLRGRGGSVPLWALIGLLGVAAGVLTFIWPGLTAYVLVLLIAAWAVVAGVLQLAAAWRLRRQIEGEWRLALAGALSLAFGTFIALMPGVGAVTVVVLLAAYAIAFGALLIALGWRLQRDQAPPLRPQAGA